MKLSMVIGFAVIALVSVLLVIRKMGKTMNWLTMRMMTATYLITVTVAVTTDEAELSGRPLSSS